MQQKFCKIYWFLLGVFAGCQCGNLPENDSELYTQQKKYYNLEAIDLGTIEAKGDLIFVFNNKQLIKEGSIYVSQDLLVYRTKDEKWGATVIGRGGISGYLKVSVGQELLREVEISTTNEVVNYQEEIGKEWPGMHNIGNTCFANATYKLLAICTGFERVLSNDTEGGINTTLRNIINGIRLGHRSALKEEVVNKKIGGLFLDVLEKVDNSAKFNDRNQHDAQVFLFHVVNLVYPWPADDDNEKLQALLELPKLDNPFLHIYKQENGDFVPTIFPVTSKKFFLVNLPLFDIVASTIPLQKQPIEIPIPSEVVRPYYDAKTYEKIGEKKYKLIGVIQHIGSDMSSGHYVAYTNHGTQGWYLHNDSQVKPVPAFNTLRTLKWLGLYKIDDQL